MNYLVLILAIVFPIPFCLFRMKKYHISMPKLLAIYLFVTISGIIGAAVGAAVSGGTLLGKRLYGLMIFDTLAIELLSPLLKIEKGKLGDFVAVPIIVTCFASKIDCIVRGCCYGIIVYRFETAPAIRFPSAAFEMIIWGVLAIILLRIECSGKAKNTLWHIALIWFGLMRFLTDFLRGSDSERRILMLGMTGARIWSFVTMVLGMILLYMTIKKMNGRNPTLLEYAKATIGNSIYHSDDGNQLS